MGFSRENQARKPTLEHIQKVPERELGVARIKQAEKPTTWVFEERIKQENPNRKLINVREDGSVNHIVNFDINTGEVLGAVEGQGLSPDSSWTRGQSWGIYGFTLSFLHSGREEYRKTAERIADYVLSVMPESNLVPVDYCQPKDIPWEDSTAAAITACGLIELAKCEDDAARAKKYLDEALALLKTLDAKRCSWDETRDELLEKCTAAYHDKEHDFTIIYGDYYFIEAVYKLCGTELFIW